MNYREKEYKEIFLKELQDALANGLISHQEEFEKYISNKQDISNFYVMLLSIHAEVFEEVYQDLTLVYNSNKLDLASGNDLDSLGYIINCPRPTGTKSSVELTFTISDIDENKTEPAGVHVSSTQGIIYETVEPLFFTPEIKTCTVQALAKKAGTSSKVIENQLTKIVSSLRNISFVKVTNNNSSFGGSDGYDDEQYRELLKNWVKTKQKGNEWAYREYFARLDGLEDYKLVPNWDGSGTIKVIISPNNEYFLNKVYNELRNEVTQLSEDIVVMSPINKSVDVFIDCNVDIDRINPYSSSEKEVIKSKIEDQIKKYFKDMKIGEDFISHKLAVFIDKNVDELKNIQFNYPSQPILINDEEKCVLGNMEVLIE